PPAIEGSDSTHDWSFLHPTQTVDFPSGARAITMPDDFGGIEGQITIAPATTLVWYPINLRNEGYVRAQYAAYPEMSSRPLCCALAPIKGTSVNAGTRFELLV